MVDKIGAQDPRPAVPTAPRASEAPADRGPTVSVVVPVLHEEREIGPLLDHLSALPGRFEVVVADGGSTDATLRLARAHSSAPRVLEVVGGRAAQCNAGAAASCGAIVLFLHADTRLPDGAYASLAGLEAAVPGGNFVLRFGGDDTFSRVLTAWYGVQRRLGVYYGDSVVFLRRSVFDALGGFRALPIMDDYDLVRRLEALGPTANVPGPAVTSARRWRAIGVPRTVFLWVVIRWLYLAGVPAARLARLYRAVR